MSDFWKDGLSIDEGPYKVLIERDKLVDFARDDRPVKIKVYYPSDYNEVKKLPVILWSHGLGGSVDGASFLSRYIASHGYIMVHIQHHGTDSSLWEGKDGHPWDIIRKTHIPRSATLARYDDVPFVLNSLPSWLEAHSEIKAMADLENTAMSGHSFGALTTQVMAGMKFPDKDGNLLDLTEPRFKAGLLYSPGSIEHLGDLDPKDVYPSIKIPLMHMTGTDDGSPLSDLGYEIRLAVFENTATERYLLVLNNGDHMVFNGSRGKLGQSQYRELHEGIIKIVSLAYWDAQLKNDAAAREWLTGEGIKSYLAENATFEAKQ